MNIKFIEVTNHPDGINWGKFMLAWFDADEWNYRSAIDGTRLLFGRGWGPGHIWVMDLQTGEGAMFKPGGYAAYDLNKHQVWVCPMFQPFLEWFYKQDLSDINALPPMVKLDAPSAIAGYRREGMMTVLRDFAKIIVEGVDSMSGEDAERVLCEADRINREAV